MQIEQGLRPIGLGPSAVALGFFDGVHRGHQAVLQGALDRQAEGLVPGAFTFTLPPHAAKMGAGWLASDASRCRLMEKLGLKALWMPPFEIFSGMSPAEFIEQVLVHIWDAKVAVCGADFRFGAGAKGDVDELRTLCASHGIEVVIVPPVAYEGEVISSTRIRQAIVAGDLEAASEMLGRAYGFTLPVRHGRALGRTRQFPTLNQPIPDGMVLPKFGVYASAVLRENRWIPAVTNIGVKPTVGSDLPLAETHLIGSCEELYDQEVTVALLRFMRPERKFSSVETLYRQIASDVAEARKISEKILAEQPERVFTA